MDSDPVHLSLNTSTRAQGVVNGDGASGPGGHRRAKEEGG